MLVSRSEAEGEHKDDLSQFMFPKSTFVASKCLANLKPSPQPRLQDK